jgi:DNA polymerase III delta subunit
VVIKGAGQIKTENKEFLLAYCRKPSPNIILVLDADRSDPRDEFINNFARHAQVSRFHEPVRLDAFMLSRQIALKQTAEALKILHQLLENGEKPERILGGLRYSCEKDSLNLQETKRKIKALINCDIEIKTGRVKPDFALEKLVVSLSGFRQAPR